jgi:hypothetical protein
MNGLALVGVLAAAAAAGDIQILRWFVATAIHRGGAELRA